MPSIPDDTPRDPALAGEGWGPASAADLRLVPGEILLLRVGMALPGGEVAALRELLTSAEAAQAARFHREGDRDRFVVRRARLRQVLARLLGVGPPQVTLVSGARGKPQLADPLAQLGFNLSHSAEWALLAFTLGGDVGVDIECARRVPDALALATRFFTREEAAYLADCAPHEVERAFLSLWTRKEAVVKCVGEGLGLGLDAFELAHRAAAGGERVRLEAAPTGELWVYPLPPPAPAAIAAVACGAPRSHVRCLALDAWDA